MIMIDLIHFAILLLLSDEKKNSVFKILYRLLHIKMSCNLMYLKIFVNTSLCNSNTSRLK